MDCVVFVILSQLCCCLFTVHKVFGSFSHGDKFISNTENGTHFCHLLPSRCFMTSEGSHVSLREEHAMCIMLWLLVLLNIHLSIKLSFHLLISPYVDTENQIMTGKLNGLGGL